MRYRLKLLACLVSLGLPGLASAQVVQWTSAMGGNNHYYEFVDFGGQQTSWDQARADAAARTHNGLTGYLTTITSGAENAFLASQFGAIGFLGGTDSASDGTWVWADGPEAGSIFYAGGAAQPGFYANWNPGEPNNNYGPENYLQFNFAQPGGWNDSRASGNSSYGYYVEYGAAVPEASTWAMLILGMGAIGGAMRRRRTALSFA